MPTKKKKKKNRNWKEYNEELVRRGELLFDTDFLVTWRSELKKMYKGKQGARFAYPNSFLNMLGAIHAYFLPYRQLELIAICSGEEARRVRKIGASSH